MRDAMLSAIIALLVLGSPVAVHADTRALLAEKARRDAGARKAQREAAERQGRYAEVCAQIRARYHPKQRGFVRSSADQAAALCTRQCGKSAGGIHEFLCTALEEPNSHQIYVNETRAEAKRVAWRGAHNRDGFIPLLAAYGLLRDVRVNNTELSLTFSNGSLIELFGADDAGQMDKLRGGAYRRVWVDEAQKLRHAQELVEDILQPAMRSQKQVLGRVGQIWLTGTPSEQAGGYFYDVTNEEKPLDGWDVHRWSVIDNPHFGATAEERWANTAGAILALNGWTGEEAKFQREWLGRWVKTDARYVYAVHKVPPHRLTFAPLRMLADGGYDHAAALQDLPKHITTGRRGIRVERDYAWLFALGVDLGYSPGAFAMVLWAYSYEQPDVYEMWSWKRAGLVPDAQAEAIKRIANAVAIAIMVGDPGGLGKGQLAGWQERYGLPIEEADKAQKRTWQELWNGDIEAGRIHYREGSPLLHEQQHLMWVPESVRRERAGGLVQPVEWANRKLKDGSTPGNHCSDGGLYSYRHLRHYMHRDEPGRPRFGTPEYFEAQERALEDATDAAMQEDDYGYYQ